MHCAASAAGATAARKASATASVAARGAMAAGGRAGCGKRGGAHQSVAQQRVSPLVGLHRAPRVTPTQFITV